MSVESVTTVGILQDVREKENGKRNVSLHPNTGARTKNEAAIALGVRAVKKQSNVRAARIEEVRARIAAGTYQLDSVAIARKMLEIEPVDPQVGEKIL